MTLKIKKSGAWSDATTVKYRSGGAWVTPSSIKRRQSGAWVQVWPVATPLAVSLNTTFAYGPAAPGGKNYSDPITATASGGTGNYTYSWTKVGGTPIQVVSPTSNTTTFSLYGTTPTTGVFRCTVSDGVSTVTSSNVTVSFE
jgi:type II secretory pathway pseudopilin PulG